MVAKIISASDVKTGTNLFVEGVPCTAKKVDISKTGRHGHAKVKIEAVGILDGQKKIFVMPGHDKLGVPSINRKKAQVLSVGEKVSVMDLESFETMDIPCAKEIKSELKENSNVEYWDVEGEKIIKRKL